MVGDDNQPVREADINIICGALQKVHTGMEQSDGTYIFEDAIPAIGKEDCEIMVEKEG